MTTESLPLIEVDRLQLGMYVVLDVGWRNHPFAFSSFILKTDEQLQQLRSIGVPKVRYCPERSTVEPLPPAAPSDIATAVDILAHAYDAPLEPPPRVLRLPVDPLQRQEAALKRAEAEFQKAAQEHQRILKQYELNPHQARRLAEQLGDEVLQWTAEGRQVAIRLLSPQVGEQPSGHEIGVSALATLLGRECGLGVDELRELALAALLHDIGKRGLPSFLHEDDGRLSEAERRTYRRHVELGIEYGEAMGLPLAVIRAIAEHHERCDGLGFPAALPGDKLCTTGRILAIVNRYQNLVCPQHVGAGISPHAALRQMYSSERSHFDPVFLPRFVRLMGIYPPGTLVELTDQRRAIVIASRPGMSLAPRVQVVESPDDDTPSLAFDLDMASGPKVRTSLRPDQLNPRWAQRARQFARSAIFLEPQDDADTSFTH